MAYITYISAIFICFIWIQILYIFKPDRMKTFFVVTLTCAFAQSPHEYMKNNNFMGTNELLNFVLGRGW